MRRPVKNRKPVLADAKYDSVRVSRLINYVMNDGKKALAEKIVYSAMEKIKEITGNPDPLEVVDMALKNAGPQVEVRSRRIGGANYQVPREVRPERKMTLAIRWMVEAARSKKGKKMHESLADELIAAYKNEGSAVKKRDDTHKMAEANKAFAHFAW